MNEMNNRTKSLLFLLLTMLWLPQLPVSAQQEDDYQHIRRGHVLIINRINSQVDFLLRDRSDNTWAKSEINAKGRRQFRSKNGLRFNSNGTIYSLRNETRYVINVDGQGHLYVEELTQ